jgi:hypothetical protein
MIQSTTTYTTKTHTKYIPRKPSSTIETYFDHEPCSNHKPLKPSLTKETHSKHKPLKHSLIIKTQWKHKPLKEFKFWDHKMKQFLEYEAYPHLGHFET